MPTSRREWPEPGRDRSVVSGHASAGATAGLPPRSMAKRAGSETIEVSASHAVYVSKPKDVALLIERAAKGSAQ